MKIPVLFLVAMIVLGMAGGCVLPARHIDLARAATPKGAPVPAPEAIVIAPIQGAIAWSAGPRAPTGLLLVTPASTVDASQLSPLNRPHLAYPLVPTEWRRLTLDTRSLGKIAKAMLDDPRFAHPQITPDSVLSIRVLRHERGRPVFAEVFIEADAAFAFAAMVTDAGAGSDAFRALLQWEMNL